jgi:hypothetical protein
MTTTNVNADGAAIKVVGVASNGEQIAAAAIGLVTAGPLGALAGWGAIRMFAGKWTPWLITGFVASPVLVLVQLVPIGILGNAVDPDRPKNDDQSSLLRYIDPFTAPAHANTTVRDNLNAADGMFKVGMDGCTNVSMSIMAVNNPGIYGTTSSSDRAEVARYARKCNLRF